jgi:hypothetical protein
MLSRRGKAEWDVNPLIFVDDDRKPTASKKTSEIEGAILKQALSDCLRNQRAALAQLADAARQVDKATLAVSTPKSADGRKRGEVRLKEPVYRMN